MTKADGFARLAGTEGIRDDLRKRSIRGALFTAGAGGVDVILRVVVTAILARLLIPEDLGMVAMVTALTAIAEQFKDLGLSTATVQCREITHEQATNLFWINVAAGVLFTLVICALSPTIGAFYRDPRLVPITLAISTNFLWGGLAVQHSALLRRQMKQPQIAMLSLTAGIFSSFVAVVLAVSGFAYWSIVFREIIRIVVQSAGIWLLCPWIPGLPRRSVEMSGLLRFGVNLTLGQIVGAVVSNIDRVLIGRFFGATSLGLYRQAQQLIITPVEQLGGPIQAVAVPGLSMLQADPERYRNFYSKIVFLVSITTVPLATFAAIYADEITRVVLGDPWIGAAPFVQACAVLCILVPTMGTIGLVMLTCGHSERILFIVILQSIFLAVAMLIAVHWNAEAVAWARVSVCLLVALTLYYAVRGTPITLSLFFRAIGPALFAAITMTLGLLLFRRLTPREPLTVCLFSGATVGFLTYTIALLALPRSRKELAEFLSEPLSSFGRLVRFEGRRRQGSPSGIIEKQ